MGSIINKFYYKSEQKLNNIEKAVFDNKLARDNIKRYIKQLDKNSIIRRNKAKEELKYNNRIKAKHNLTMSQLYSKQSEIANSQLLLIEEQIAKIEFVTEQKETLKVLEEGNKILKIINSEVNIEKWEKIADDVKSYKEHYKEISDFLISHNINENEFDEKINKEFEYLMEDLNQKSSEDKIRDKKSEDKEINFNQINDNKVLIEM